MRIVSFDDGGVGLCFAQPIGETAPLLPAPDSFSWLVPCFEHLLALEGLEAMHDSGAPESVDVVLPTGLHDVIRDLCRLARLRVDAPRHIGCLGRWALPLWIGKTLPAGLEPGDLPVLARWLRQLVLDGRAPAFIAFEAGLFLEGRSGARHRCPGEGHPERR